MTQYREPQDDERYEEEEPPEYTETPEGAYERKVQDLIYLIDDVVREVADRHRPQQVVVNVITPLTQFYIWMGQAFCLLLLLSGIVAGMWWNLR